MLRVLYEIWRVSEASRQSRYPLQQVIMSAMASQTIGISDCLFNRLIKPTSKKTSKFCVTGICEGKPPMTGEFPHKGPVLWKMFAFDDVIMMWFGATYRCDVASLQGSQSTLSQNSIRRTYSKNVKKMLHIWYVTIVADWPQNGDKAFVLIFHLVLPKSEMGRVDWNTEPHIIKSNIFILHIADFIDII